MKDIINEINNSDTFVRLIEVGAGVAIANEIFNYPGASKTVYCSESHYARPSFIKEFGEHNAPRAVSAEILKHINDHLDIANDFKNGIYNTVLSTTFQVGDETNSTSTHGWISVNIENCSIQYYHISIHKPLTRKRYIELVGEIGIKLLHGQNDFDIVADDCYIDMVLNENLEPLKGRTLDFIRHSNNSDMMTVFKTDYSIDRLESITRDNKSLIVYKGSFNPPTISHKEIIDNTILLCQPDQPKALFCISCNTYQKGSQDTESLLGRINMLNKLGYDVIISNKPLFTNAHDLLRYKFKGKIIFPMGVDTLNRLGKDYDFEGGRIKISPNGKLIPIKFVNDFKNTEFIVYQRDNEVLGPNIQRCLVDNELVNLMDDSYTKGISSTIVRNHVINGEFDEIKLLVPDQIYNDIIETKYN